MEINREFAEVLDGIYDFAEINYIIITDDEEEKAKFNCKDMALAYLETVLYILNYFNYLSIIPQYYDRILETANEFRMKYKDKEVTEYSNLVIQKINALRNNQNQTPDISIFYRNRDILFNIPLFQIEDNPHILGQIGAQKIS